MNNKLERKDKLLVGANLLILICLTVFYYNTTLRFKELEYELSVFDDGFKSIDETYSDSLDHVRSYISGKVDGKYLDSIKNDSLWYYISGH